MNVGLFIDVSDLYYNVGKKFDKKKLDYAKLLTRLVGTDTLYRAIAYTSQDAKPFMAYLRHVNFEPKMIPGDCVVDMALDIVRLSDKLDIIYIGSNDHRILPLVMYAKERGIKIVIVNANICYTLRSNTDTWVEITENDLQ